MVTDGTLEKLMDTEIFGQVRKNYQLYEFFLINNDFRVHEENYLPVGATEIFSGILGSSRF